MIEYYEETESSKVKNIINKATSMAVTEPVIAAKKITLVSSLILCLNTAQHSTHTHNTLFSFNTAIPVRSLGPYMYVHYCTCIVHILVWAYLFRLTSFFDYLSFMWIVFKTSI